MNTPGLMPRQTITTIVENVDQARHDIDQAFKLLQSAKERLAAVLGDGKSTQYGHLWHRMDNYDMAANNASVQRTIAKNAWGYVLHLTGVMQYMTEKRKDALVEQLKKGTFPVLTVDNV